MPTKLLPVPYHRQEGLNYCGAACMKMVIESLGGPSEDQDDLYLDAHSSGTKDPGTNWYSPPDGLEKTLDDVSALPQDFDLVSLLSETSITRRVVWSVHSGVPPIALVYGYTHWVVVVGYDVSDHPTGPTDTSYSISALEIHDPWRATGEGDPPPPPPPKHVTFSQWKIKYLKPVPLGYWLGKRVAVGEFTGPSAKKEAKRAAEPKPPGFGSTQAPIIPPDEALKGTIRGLERYGLYKRTDWAPLLVSPVAPVQPVLVQRLDEPGGYYYLVPFSATERKIEAAVMVDAFTGEYLEASALASAKDGRQWSRLISDATNSNLLRRNLVGRRFELPGNAGRVLARHEGLGLHPTLVWRPCVESLSPYYPFRLVTIGSVRRYVRIDGEEFAELHDAGPGG